MKEDVEKWYGNGGEALVLHCIDLEPVLVCPAAPSSDEGNMELAGEDIRLRSKIV